jgi:hypothetical protein
MEFMMLVLGLASGPQQLPTTLEALRAAVAAPAVETSSVQQLTIRWEAYSSPADALVAPAAAARLDEFQLLARTVVEGTAVRERNPELSADRLVIVLTDAQGAVRYWSSIPDPRIVRAEQPGPDGVLTGVTLHRRQADFLLALPNISAAAQVRIYEPHWDGNEWTLDQVGAVTMPAAAR